MILDRVVSIARLTPDNSDNDKETYVTVSGLEGVKMNIQPADAELIALTEGQVGRTYKAFTAISGIQISDKITISGSSTSYLVKGISDWYFGPIPHLELVLWLGDE